MTTDKEKYINLENSELFEKIFHQNAIVYVCKKYRGPIAIDAIPHKPKVREEENANL